MRILKANAGSLTNAEVLDFLKSRGASKDPTRVIAPISRSEYKVYDYLVETPASTQTPESVKAFVEQSKGFKLAKAEILNIINLRPSSILDLHPIVEKQDVRDIDTDGVLELVKEVFPTTESPEGAVEEEKDHANENTEKNEDETAEEGESMAAS